jgi:hypothetical protein
MESAKVHMTDVLHFFVPIFIGLALVGKDMVFRFIIEYSSLMDFGS